MELVFVRHGLPLRIDDAGGPADPALAPEGMRQAEQLASWLGTNGLAAIYASPMRRAVETAAPLARTLGLEVRGEAGLEEFDAHLHYYIPMEELDPTDPRWDELMHEWNSPEALEARLTFRARVVEAVERIVAAHPSQKVALVCHGGVVNAYLSHILEIDRTLFFEPAYTSISRVLASSQGHRQLVSANETPHLTG